MMQRVYQYMLCTLLVQALFISGFADAQTIEVPEITGPFIHIFDPNDTRSDSAGVWYTNDHCFTRASDGTWHAYGIIGHKPVKPWTGETRFFHISSPSLTAGKWEDHGYAMTALPGKERVLWAPHIFSRNDSAFMFYNVGNLQPHAPNYASWGQLMLATSTDLFHWERYERNPLFSDPGHARDSYIMYDEGTYYYYYTRTYSEVDLRSVVAVRKGPDLLTWSGPRIAHVQPYRVDWGGDAESPFVVRRNGIYYLFVCRAMTAYNQTHVYWSTDPENFPNDQFVCSLPVHAGEVIHDGQTGDWFISDTGWDKRGVYIAPLRWRASTVACKAGSSAFTE